MTGTGTLQDQEARSPTVPPPQCVIVDDAPDVRHVIARAAADCGVQAVELDSAAAVGGALSGLRPNLIFLDIAMDGSDAIEAVRGLAGREFAGAVQIVSGLQAAILDEVRKLGEHHGLRMRKPLPKPFTAEAIRNAVTEECLGCTTASQHRVGLGEALSHGWLEFWYQPKLDLRTCSVIGAEALARVRHPVHGLLLPQDFLARAPQAELAELSGVAVIAALRDWSYFHARGANLKLAVNVKVSDLVRLPLTAIVREYRPRHDDWPGLILEVTEDELLQDIALVRDVATQLELHQVGLSIDDFGSGYSSMRRLCELACVELKLDRSLVANCADNERNGKVCASLVQLCHDLGVAVTAEGIERPSELHELTRIGCDLGQGFLFSPAVPRERLLDGKRGAPRGEAMPACMDGRGRGTAGR